MGREDGVSRVIWAALSIAITIITLLVSAWAVDISRRLEVVSERQRDVLIRLRSLEVEHARRQQWPSSDR